MNHKDALEILFDIERHIDVNEYWIDGVQVWPIVRRDIWMHLLSLKNIQRLAQPVPVDMGQKAESSGVSGKTRSKMGRIPALCRLLSSHLSQVLEPADVLFWSRQEDHTEIFSEGVVDRIIDPMMWFVRNEGYTTLKLSRSDSLERKGISQVEPSVIVTPDQMQESCIIEPPRGSAEELITAIKEIIPYLPITNSHAISAVRRLNSRSDYFEIVLDMVKPRLVMLGVFYAADAMALIHACRRRNIPVVDVQHGKQGLYHAMYGGWSVMPVKGYSVLPDVFWTWGSESAEVIRLSLPEQSSRPQAIVGGNRWLATWKTQNKHRLTVQQDVQYLLGRMNDFQRTILVTLQPLSDPLPSPLLEAMKKAPPDWFWLVRTHPHQRKDISNLESRIEATGLQAYDIQCASSAPLYPLLYRSDIHVTCWSSVAYEALAMSKPTILVDPTALKLYDSYISRNLFSYTSTADELLDAITELPGKPLPKEANSYIETSDNIAKEALAKCLSMNKGGFFGNFWSALRRRTTDPLSAGGGTT